MSVFGRAECGVLRDAWHEMTTSSVKDTLGHCCARQIGWAHTRSHSIFLSTVDSVYLFQAAPAQQGPDDVALGHIDGERGDHVGADQDAPVGVVLRQEDGEVEGVRAPGEARLQEHTLSSHNDMVSSEFLRCQGTMLRLGQASARGY